MKIPKTKKILRGLALALAGLMPLLSFTPVLAASASMSLVPSGSGVKGSLVTVSIRENSGAEPVNAAKATLSYPTAQLQFISIGSSAAFSIVAANSGGNGSVNIDRGALPAVSGSQTVASVSFRALSDSGTAAVSISSGAVISANSNTNILAGSSGTSIALKAPAVVAPPPPPDTIPPTITKVASTGITSVSAVITWTTSEPATAEISYGPSNAYGLAAVDPTPVTDHKVTLNSPLIQPGITYHFSVKSTDPAGNAASSPDATFTTQGAVLIATVIDQNKKPLSGAKVEFESKSATTNKQGIAKLEGLTLGKQYGVVTFRNHKYPVSVQISSAAKDQTSTLQLKIQINYTIPVILVVIMLLVIDYLIARRGGGGGGLAIGALKSLKTKMPKFSALNRLNKADIAPLPPSPPAASSSAQIVHPNDKT